MADVKKRQVHAYQHKNKKNPLLNVRSQLFLTLNVYVQADLNVNPNGKRTVDVENRIRAEKVETSSLQDITRNNIKNIFTSILENTFNKT